MSKDATQEKASAPAKPKKEVKMNLHIQSKEGKSPAQSTQLYQMLADFNNIKRSLPPEHKDSFFCNRDSCLLPLGKRLKPLPVRITYRDPGKLIKYANDGGKINFVASMTFTQLQQNKGTKVKLVIDAKLNFLLRWILKKQLQNFADSFVSSICNAPVQTQYVRR